METVIFLAYGMEAGNFWNSVPEFRNAKFKEKFFQTVLEQDSVITLETSQTYLKEKTVSNSNYIIESLKHNH